MSDDNKDLGDDLNDMLGDAKEGAKKAADKVSAKASELADDAKELAGEAKEKAAEFADDAKETATEFTDGAKEAFNSASGENKKVLAGILAIILGSLGVHKFILGYNKEGGILLGITIGVIWLLLKYCQGKIGGITGDILGALNEIVELCCLLVLCLF